MKTNTILTEMRSTLKKLQSGEITIQQAQAEARLYVVQNKYIDHMLTHARLTGRLEKNSNVLPDMKIGDE